MNIDPKKTVFLIDGSSFLYRAYYGVRPLHTPSGEPVQAVYSFCRMIKKLLDTFKPQYIALVWDSKGKTTRHELYSAYKATRQEPPSDLFGQKERIMAFADLIGIAQVSQTGIEADDIIYSIAQECKQESDTVVMITSDKDMGQAIDDKVVMYDAFNDIVLDKKAFEEKMAFAVERLPFYFALLGDTSDNIPGVRGIGKKGALDLVQQFGSLEELYTNIDQVAKPRMKTALIEGKENAFLSRDLFLLQYYPSKITKQELAFDNHNWGKAAPLFQELGFKSLLTGLSSTHKAPAVSLDEKIVASTKNCVLVTSPEALAEVVALAQGSSMLALDTETTGIDPFVDELVGISLCVDTEKAYYIPCGHTTGEQQLSLRQVADALSPIFADTTIKKCLHNAKFDQLVLLNAGISLHGVFFDTMIAAHLVAKEWQRLSLKALSEHYLHEPMLTYEQVVGSGSYKNFAQVPLALATTYAAADALQTLKLYEKLSHELRISSMEQLFYEVEMPVLQVLVAMEYEGIKLDATVLKKLGATVAQELDLIEKQIGAFVPEKHVAINLNSPRQVEKLLFEDLLLPPQKKSGKGTAYSTDSEVLSVLAKMHPVPGLISKYREYAKLKSTYIDALSGYISPKTGRIHTSYSQINVATGRLASSNPNLQNIPTNSSGYGIEIREAFKPREGNCFLSADYSQIELRVLAHLSQDEQLKKAFLQGHDIHAETAARLFDTPLQEVTHDQRQIGKRINFSILYGLTPYGLSKDLEISFTDAKRYIEKYFKQYPQVSIWMESVVAFAKEHGYVQTHWGRRRYIPAIYERNKVLYEEARRVAVNTVAQGTAAEIMKKGMVAVSRAFDETGCNARILLQIHDELLVTVAHDEQQSAQEMVKGALEGVVAWSVPLVVTVRTGDSWKEVTK